MTDDMDVTAPVLGGTNHGSRAPVRNTTLQLPTRRKYYATFDPAGHGPKPMYQTREVYRLETFGNGLWHYGLPERVVAWVPLKATNEEAVALAKAHFGGGE